MTVRNTIDIKFTNIVTRQIIDAYRRANSQIKKLDYHDITNIDRVVDIVSKEYDQSTVANSDNMYNMSRLQYSSAIRQIQAQIRKQANAYKYNYNKQDTATLNVLDQNNTLFVGKYFDNQAEQRIRTEMSKIITEQKTKKEVADSITKMLTIEGQYGYSYSKMIVETNGTWARSIGKTNVLEDSGFTTYEYLVTVDDVTSDICQELAGQQNTVQNAIDTRDDYLNIDTSDYKSAINDLNKVSPFITGNKETGFMANGIKYSDPMQIAGIALPPFHPNCRTEIIAVS